MNYTNKKLLMALTVLATPIAIDAIVEENTAQASENKYTLNKTVKTYTTAQAAVAKTPAKSTYTQGNYYVYKSHAGMLNISKVAGKAGAWINPSENTEQVSTRPASTPENTAATRTVKTSTPETTNSSTYTLNTNVKTYATAQNAVNKTAPRSIYAQGNYYVYKSYAGMLNISKVAGRAGAWINPSENSTTNVETPKVEVQSTVNTPGPLGPNVTIKKDAATYTINSSAKVYATAANALAKTGARATYSQGEYYIYKKAPNGMLNISKVLGRAGAWINPYENGLAVEEPVYTKPQNTESRPTAPTSPKVENKAPNKYDGLEYKARYELANDTAAYSNAVSARQGVGAVSKYTKGTYYIYKNVNGMLNISKTPGRAGAWINPTASESVVARGTISGASGLQGFQYKNLNSTSNYTASELNRALNAFGGGSGKLAGRGAAFKKAEATYNVNALYLLSHAALESGWGKSKIAADKNNFFGIAAYDNSPYESATTFDGVEAGIMDGAKWISGRYLKSNSFPASGPYLGDKSSGMNKHYATDPNWGYKIADIMNRINNLLGRKDK